DQPIAAHGRANPSSSTRRTCQKQFALAAGAKFWLLGAAYQRHLAPKLAHYRQTPRLDSRAVTRRKTKACRLIFYAAEPIIRHRNARNHDGLPNRHPCPKPKRARARKLSITILPPLFRS